MAGWDGGSRGGGGCRGGGKCCDPLGGPSEPEAALSLLPCPCGGIGWEQIACLPHGPPHQVRCMLLPWLLQNPLCGSSAPSATASPPWPSLRRPTCLPPAARTRTRCAGRHRLDALAGVKVGWLGRLGGEACWHSVRLHRSTVQCVEGQIKEAYSCHFCGIADFAAVRTSRGWPGIGGAGGSADAGAEPGPLCWGHCAPV